MSRHGDQCFKRSHSEDIRNTHQGRTANDDLKKQNDAYCSEILQLKEQITKIEKEKDEALSRFSKLAGEKLTKENPLITDLGNPNRPAKIAEKWGSLYSDEWTDAYEDMKKHYTEKEEPEKKLMRITNWCYQKCRFIAEKQIEVIKKELRIAVCRIYLLDNQCDTPTNDNLFSCENIKVDGIITSTIEQVKDLRQTSLTLVEAAKNMCITDYKKNNPKASPNEMKFVMKCTELCWHMCTSSPNMVIEFENFEEKTIDSNKFNLYNRTGTIVEFVVWPVLLLHDNGPVLAKGTVQTIPKPKKHSTNINTLMNKITTPLQCIDNFKEAQFETYLITDDKQSTNTDFNNPLSVTDTWVNSPLELIHQTTISTCNGENCDAQAREIRNVTEPTQSAISTSRNKTYNKPVDEFKKSEEETVRRLEEKQMSIEHENKQELEQWNIIKENREIGSSKSYGQPQKVDFKSITNSSNEKLKLRTHGNVLLSTDQERAKQESNLQGYEKQERSTIENINPTNIYLRSVDEVSEQTVNPNNISKGYKILTDAAKLDPQLKTQVAIVTHL